MKVGVLALQGAFREHREVLDALDVETIEVRTPSQLGALDALILPGGESTTMSQLLGSSGVRAPLAERLADGFPVLGTCAGMILLDRDHLGLADLVVDRNAYGRQVASFEADLVLEGEERPFRGVFIRAPRVRDVGPQVEVLAELDGEPVLLRDGRVLVAAFHPELTDDSRIHRQFLDLVTEATSVRA